MRSGSVRQHARCPYFHGDEAARARYAGVAARRQEPRSCFFATRGPTTASTRASLKINPPLDSPVFAALAGRRVFRQPGAGSPRRPVRRTSRNLQQPGCRALPTHTTSSSGNKNFLRLLGRNSYYKQLPKTLVLASNTEFGVIRPFHTGGIAASEYIPLPERFFGGGKSTMRRLRLELVGGAARSGDRISAGRQRAAVPQHRTALPADRRQHRRRSVSRYG